METTQYRASIRFGRRYSVLGSAAPFLFRFISLTLLWLALGLFANADDTLVTLGAGGLVPIRSSEIVMKSEDLQISIHQVSVHYVFENTSDHDVSATIAFPLPELDGTVVENSPLELPSKNPVNFITFRVSVDGKPITPKTEIRAFKNEKEISKRLVSLGLPLSVLSPNMGAAVAKLSKAQRDQLTKDELIVEEEQNGKYRYWPWWDTRIQYYWRQHFPAKSTVRIEHSYRPVVGGGYIYADGIESADLKSYCGTAATTGKMRDFKQHHAVKQLSNISFFEREVQFVLKTANNWNGPIGKFRLRVTTDSPDDILVTCLSGLKQVTPTNYELLHTSFRPDQDLDLLILQPSK